MAVDDMTISSELEPPDDEALSWNPTGVLVTLVGALDNIMTMIGKKPLDYAVEQMRHALNGWSPGETEAERVLFEAMVRAFMAATGGRTDLAIQYLERWHDPFAGTGIKFRVSIGTEHGRPREGVFDTPAAVTAFVDATLRELYPGTEDIDRSIAEISSVFLTCLRGGLMYTAEDLARKMAARAARRTCHHDIESTLISYGPASFSIIIPATTARHLKLVP